jgi:hypothetical protein
MESGTREDLRTAMNDIAATVEYMVEREPSILEDDE